MRFLRTHPVLFAAIIGAIVGLGNALAIEIPALLGKPSHGVLSLLGPASSLHAGAGALETAFLLLIEFAANILVWAALFAVLGWIFVGIRRIFRSTHQTETKNSPET